MNGRLAGKIAVITAAGQGIGRATAVAFADEGAMVWATDLNESLVAELSRERPTIRSRKLDVRDSEDVEKFATELGAIDILFNCAGYVHHGTILDCGEKDWDFSFDLNVKSMYRTCRAFLPAMLKAGKGSIINMASAASSIKAAPNRFVYGSTKAAVIGLTKAIAADFIRSGIRCNAICPGTVQSPSLDQRIAAQGDVEKVRSEFVARQPMGRIGRPDEIASLAVYLASEESSYTTGQIHIIDGGFSL
ncbi:MAG TPA: SDR family oxidoreductase [Terriglobales bacterium]|jgi:2-keto-3-deoxy-L-fuconate dehydrogenase|nr:SDR family oxidoreductase [Terriglobales bacterium]